MKDNFMNKIEKLLSIRDIGSNYIIRTEYDNTYGDIFCYCYLVPRRKKEGSFGYMSYGDSGDIDNALDKLIRLMQESSKFELVCPDVSDQKYNNGYVRREIDNWEISWKRVDDIFYVNCCVEKDPANFYILTTPRRLDDYRNAKKFNDEDISRFAKHEKLLQMFKDECLDKIKLKDGEELWMWDDIGFLSGCSGLIIVNNGLVIKEKIIIRS